MRLPLTEADLRLCKAAANRASLLQYALTFAFKISPALLS